MPFLALLFTSFILGQTYTEGDVVSDFGTVCYNGGGLIMNMV